MKIYLNTANKPCHILLRLHSDKACELRLFGDTGHRNTRYFDRYPVPLAEGLNTVEIPLPMSPKKLCIRGMKMLGEGKVRLKDWQMRAIPIAPSWTSEEKDFIALAQYMSKHAGYLGTGIYSSPSGKIKLRFAKILRDEAGNPVYTPARVDVYKPYIEASHSLRQYTVAMRMFILCHEYGHYLHHSFDELLADRAGVELYLKAGYPRSEAYYALSDILRDDVEGNQRLASMKQLLSEETNLPSPYFMDTYG